MICVVQKSEIAITLMSKCGITDENKSILFCFIYIPPIFSPTYDYLVEENGMLLLKDQIIKMTSNYPECRIFLGGDFNSRTGNLYDYVIDDSVDYLPTDYYESNYFNIPRNTKDNVNDNGRFTGDRHGEMTCCTHNGSSIVDYMIVSSDLFINITDFRILNFDESSHFPLTCNINIGKSTGNCTASNDVNTRVRA